MSTDLRTALREAVADPPPYGVEPAAVIRAAHRRRRRRGGIAVGGVALAAAAVVVATALSGQQPPDPDPAPAEVERLDLDDAVPADLDIAATVRTTWKDVGKNSLEYDRYEGLTADGLVLRGRNRNEHGFPELGLLDPRTGTTDWLPPSPVALWDPIPLELAEDGLVLFKAEGNGHAILVFDRASRTWQHSVVRIPYGIEVHLPPHVVLGGDDRVYVGSTMEGESSPFHWWSAPVRGGGVARPEPALEGTTVAWAGGIRVTASATGRVVVTSPNGDDVVSHQRPEGCTLPAELPNWPPEVVLAGDRPVVSYICDVGEPDVTGSRTVVYPRDGGRPIEIADAWVRTADERRVVLSGGPPVAPAAHPGASSTYVLDLSERRLARVGPGTHESQVALADGLLLWNAPGPTDDDDAYDVIWRVAQLR